MISTPPIQSRAAARWLRGYIVAGPLVTIALAAGTGALASRRVWSSNPLLTAAGQVLLGLVLWAILRPQTYARSAWRAFAGMLWLTPALVLSGSVTAPGFTLPSSSRLHDVWAVAWIAAGCTACFFAALSSSIPRKAHAFNGKLRFAVVLGAVNVLALVAWSAYVIVSLPIGLARAHLDDNLPGEGQLDALVERDLTAYFTASDPASGPVHFALLHDLPIPNLRGPDPGYVIWVVVDSGSGSSTQGVVTLVAEHRTRIQVLEFLTREKILAQPKLVQKCFSPRMAAEIERRAGAASRGEDSLDPTLADANADRPSRSTPARVFVSLH